MGKISAETFFSQNNVADKDLITVNVSSLASPTSSFLSPPCSPLGSPGDATAMSADVPDTTEGMTIEDFRKWTVPQLTQYLSDRCIIKSGNKKKLIENVYGAYTQKLPITFTDPQQEKEQIEVDIREKNFYLKMAC